MLKNMKTSIRHFRGRFLPTIETTHTYCYRVEDLFDYVELDKIKQRKYQKQLIKGKHWIKNVGPSTPLEILTA